MAAIVKNINYKNCESLLYSFFEEYPNSDLERKAHWALKKLMLNKTPMPGKVGGWAGGIVYAVSSIGVGVPGVLNSELLKAFSVSMDTIYKRAAMIRRSLLNMGV